MEADNTMFIHSYGAPIFDVEFEVEVRVRISELIRNCFFVRSGVSVLRRGIAQTKTAAVSLFRYFPQAELMNVKCKPLRIEINFGAKEGISCGEFACEGISSSLQVFRQGRMQSAGDLDSITNQSTVRKIYLTSKRACSEFGLVISDLGALLRSWEEVMS